MGRVLCTFVRWLGSGVTLDDARELTSDLVEVLPVGSSRVLRQLSFVGITSILRFILSEEPSAETLDHSLLGKDRSVAPTSFLLLPLPLMSLIGDSISVPNPLAPILAVYPALGLKLPGLPGEVGETHGDASKFVITGSVAPLLRPNRRRTESLTGVTPENGRLLWIGLLERLLRWPRSLWARWMMLSLPAAEKLAAGTMLRG